MMYVLLRLLIICLAVAGLLAGCADTTSLAGVELESVVPQPTHAPDSLGALTGQHTLEFLDMMITFAFPSGWEVGQQAQAAIAHLTETEDYLPQFGVRLWNDPDWIETPTAVDMSRFRLFLDVFDPYSRLSTDFELGPVLLVSEAPVTFAWGPYDAAAFAYVFHHDTFDLDILKLQAALQVSEQQQFVLFWAALPIEEASETQTVMLAMFGSAGVNGEMLPGESVLEALALAQEALVVYGSGG